jgi:cobalamin biosynthesis protein CobT
MKRKDLISRDNDFVHRGGFRSGWDKDFESTTNYVLGNSHRPATVEGQLREINKLCTNRCSIIADGRKVEFSINPHEKTAVTDGRRVLVGTTVLDEKGKTFEQKADIMVGLTTHEMAHIRFTDFSKKPTSKLHQSVLNIVEDERIEHLLTDEFPGYAKNLADVKKYMLDERYLINKAIEDSTLGFKKITEKEKAALEVFDIFFKLVRYPVHIDETLYKKHEKKINKLRKLLTPYPMTFDAAYEVSGKIAKIIKKMMKEAMSPPKPQLKAKEKCENENQSKKNKETGESKGSGKESKSEKEEKENPKEENKDEKETKTFSKEKEEDEKEDGQEEQDKEQDSEKDSEDSGEESESEEDSDKSDSGEESKTPQEAKAEAKEIRETLMQIEIHISEMMEAFVSDNDKSKKVQDSMVASTIKFNEEFVHDSENEAIFHIGEPDKSRYTHLASNVSSDARRLANSLYTKTFNEAKNLRGLQSGQLDDAKIVEAAHGVPTVHTHRIEKETRELNIVVLIDESGSMGPQGGPKVDNASKAAILIEKAFESFPAGKLFIYGFTSDYNGEEKNTIFRYREPGMKVRYGLGSVRGRANNRDGDCMRAVAKRVRQFTQDPMLFFMISDGQPSAWGYNGIKDTRHAVTHISKMKFFPIQIGIGKEINEKTQALMFDEFIHYDSPKQMVDDLRKLILRKAHKIFGL